MHLCIYHTCTCAYSTSKIQTLYVLEVGFLGILHLGTLLPPQNIRTEVLRLIDISFELGKLPRVDPRRSNYQS
ncbi:hypothetical protein BDQ12DRAFT_57594 [Crucibulum laeve]|uniref:Uncharacterized protein n=1 Tax=Crucibulum laeve TaxID=68775 RepID=A0A5C3M285_9AGAR|nr:hypothetical protein BDQ12DRAFT_57594 [Crucibulum laeve]